MKTLFFDDGEHKYYLIDGEARQEIPGVTRIMKDVGITDDRWYTPGPRDRGTMVHEALELVNRGLVGPESYDGTEVRPFLDAVQACVEAEGWRIDAAETPVFHPAFEYGGTVDSVYLDKEGRRILVDYKTGAPADWHPLQLAAYRDAYIFHQKVKIDDVAVLYIKADGKYKLARKVKHRGVEMEMGSAFFRETWLGIVRTWKWRFGGK